LVTQGYIVTHREIYVYIIPTHLRKLLALYPSLVYTAHCIGLPNFRTGIQKKEGDIVNKFALWIESQDKKQRGVAQKLGISTSTLHDILRQGQMPSLRLAYEIEKYTKGAITVYDWLDGDARSEKKTMSKITTQEIAKNIST